MQDVREIRSRHDVYAGAIFVLVALAFGLEAASYPLGTALRMGPGFMPLLLAVLLALFGILVLATGLRNSVTITPSPIPWKGLVLLCLAIVLFGAFAQRLGLVPIVFVCTFVVAMASARNRPVDAGLIAAIMAALCWVVFKLGLGITLPTFGPLLSF